MTLQLWWASASQVLFVMAALFVPLLGVVYLFARPEWRAHPTQMLRDLALVVAFWCAVWASLGVVMALRN